MRLYETTKNDKYLKLAKYFIDERGTRPYYFDRSAPGRSKEESDGLRYEYNQAHLPVRGGRMKQSDIGTCRVPLFRHGRYARLSMTTSSLKHATRSGTI